MAKWQPHSTSPPSTCSPSCKVMNCWQGIKGEWCSLCTMPVTTCWHTWTLGRALCQRGHRPAPWGHAAKWQRSTWVCLCVCEHGQIGWVTCALPDRRFNFTTTSLFVSLYPSVCISLSHTPLSLFVADQQQVEADWEGVQSEARKVCPGKHFFLFYPISHPFHFIFLFFPWTAWKIRQMYRWEGWRKHTWKHTHVHTYLNSQQASPPSPWSACAQTHIPCHMGISVEQSFDK